MQDFNQGSLMPSCIVSVREACCCCCLISELVVFYLDFLEADSETENSYENNVLQSVPWKNQEENKEMGQERKESQVRGNTKQR